MIFVKMVIMMMSHDNDGPDDDGDEDGCVDECVVTRSILVTSLMIIMTVVIVVIGKSALTTKKFEGTSWKLLELRQSRK